MPVQTAPTVLESQIRFYAEQASSWADDQPPAASRADLEAVIALGLTTFAQIRKAEQRAGEEARLKPAATDVDAARDLASLYRRWGTPSEAILTQVKRIRAEGHRVDRADEFVQACRHARIPALYTEHLISALARD
jgi:hypothetical protein